MTEENMKQFETMLGRHLGVLHEAFQHKLDLVVEGQQAIGEKVDRLEGRVERLAGKVDGIAVELAAHRADTEAHHKVWGVREE